MTGKNYLKDKILGILGNIFAMFCLWGYLAINQLSRDSIILIIIAWNVVLILYHLIQFNQRKRFHKKIEYLLSTLDQKYVLAELIEPSFRLEDQLYRYYLHKSNKSVIEKIHQLEDEQKEYKEYIEGWIHEVKRPITAIQLMCENNKNEITRKLKPLLFDIENDVEQALFFARSEAVYKDYMIREINLKPIIVDILSKNKEVFIQNQMSVSIECEEDTIYGDDKWITFIINQILNNAVKYRCNNKPTIHFYTQNVTHGRSLVIEDNGIGIKKSELGRVFDKGFTGTNGRQNEKSTGIGLYLCKRLCDKLGIQIEADSIEGSYTKIILVFPIGDYISNLSKS